MAVDNSSVGKIADRARKLAEPFAEKLGLVLWDVRFLKEGSEWYLRYFIDKPGGVDINDCEALSRAVDRPLDDEDFVDRSYCLEVSSPGLGRKLTRPEHFEALRSEEVTVRLIHAIDGVKEYCGELLGLDGGIISINTTDGKKDIPKAQVAFVKLNDDIFDDTEE